MAASVTLREWLLVLLWIVSAHSLDPVAWKGHIQELSVISDLPEHAETLIEDPTSPGDMLIAFSDHIVRITPNGIVANIRTLHGANHNWVSMFFVSNNSCLLLATYSAIYEVDLRSDSEQLYTGCSRYSGYVLEGHRLDIRYSNSYSTVHDGVEMIYIALYSRMQVLALNMRTNRSAAIFDLHTANPDKMTFDLTTSSIMMSAFNTETMGEYTGSSVGRLDLTSGNFSWLITGPVSSDVQLQTAPFFINLTWTSGFQKIDDKTWLVGDGVAQSRLLVVDLETGSTTQICALEEPLEEFDSSVDSCRIKCKAFLLLGGNLYLASRIHNNREVMIKAEIGPPSPCFKKEDNCWQLSGRMSECTGSSQCSAGVYEQKVPANPSSKTSCRRVVENLMSSSRLACGYKCLETDECIGVFHSTESHRCLLTGHSMIYAADSCYNMTEYKYFERV